MPAYHSVFQDNEAEVIGMPILPLKTAVRGPAPQASGDDEDIIDEAIKFYRANVLFASYTIESPSDRIIIFLTLFISQCMKRMEKASSKQSGVKIMFELAKEKFPLPGESGWLLGGHIPAPKSRDEEDRARNYLKQLREECGLRLLEKLYAHSDAAPDKFWMGFSKRKFMNILVR
mmetsp:Transcript_10348/g.20379  ORF Transcript_10348/g.20379 Transcript_10348/m.20379 type:complete len:175 (+) Transcript_10348:404-928(+)|eukprot:CAMPEP_0171492050 /NCGR_PEP_ID=MMETSP0958-20121227/4196_1 /TAXON_ID=87120 /ORGANISM="Aurantiochytrium limacinum, Strain ATCCMYA-1381" /LENGTH=174 /DNA_ID=CAMNT_0012025529 /DNA_START=310 /DNA_END=834 /DNA_ORIENTATION=+